jgi:hypothetical protein
MLFASPNDGYLMARKNLQKRVCTSFILQKTGAKIGPAPMPYTMIEISANYLHPVK